MIGQLIVVMVLIHFGSINFAEFFRTVDVELGVLVVLFSKLYSFDDILCQVRHFFKRAIL